MVNTPVFEYISDETAFNAEELKKIQDAFWSDPITQKMNSLLAKKYEIQQLKNKLDKEKLQLKEQLSQTIADIIETNGWSIQKTAKILKVSLHVFYKIIGASSSKYTATQVSQQMLFKIVGDVIKLQRHQPEFDLARSKNESTRRKKRGENANN